MHSMSTVDYETSAAITTGVGELQEIVNDGLRTLPVAFADLDIEAQAAFCIKYENRVNFELKHNDAVFTGMPLLVTGNSLFLVESIKEEPEIEAQRMIEGQTLRGIVDNARVQPISPLSVVLERSAATMREVQVSVLLKLAAAVFESEGVEYDLEQEYDTYIPLVYPGLIYDREDITWLE